MSFYLGIKYFRFAYLNMTFKCYIATIKYQTQLKDLKPFGNDNKSYSFNIKIFIIKQICNIFNLSKSPIYHDNIQSVLNT